MLFVSLTDLDGNRVQVNVGSVAYYGPDKPRKGALIHFAVAGGAGFVPLQVAESPEEIATQISAKLRK
jgi:hypothetical protein